MHNVTLYFQTVANGISQTSTIMDLAVQVDPVTAAAVKSLYEASMVNSNQPFPSFFIVIN